MYKILVYGFGFAIFKGIRRFPKIWIPQTLGFPIDNKIFWLILGYTHCRKPPYEQQPCEAHSLATLAPFATKFIWSIPQNDNSNSCQWEFQDPKMEVLYHIRPYFGGISPYIALKHRPKIYGRYLQFRFLEWPLIMGKVLLTVSPLDFATVCILWYFSTAMETMAHFSWFSLFSSSLS